MNWSMEEERSRLSREHNTSSDLQSSQSDKQPLLNSSNSSSANLPGKSNAARDTSSSWQRQGSPDDVAKTFPSSPASVSLDPQSSNLPQEKNPTHGSDSASSCNLLSPSSLPQTHKSVNKELAISSSSLHTQLNQYSKHHGHELIEPTDVELGSDLSELGKSTNYLLPHTTHYSGYTPAPGVPSEIKRARGRPRKERLSSASRQASTRGVSGKDQAHSFASRGLRRAVGRNIRRGGNRGSRQGRGHTRYSEALSVLSERHSPRNLLSPTQFLLNRLSPATKSGAQRPPGMSDSMKQSINAPPFSGQDGNSNDGLSPTQGTCSGSSEIVVTPESQSSGHLCALCNCGERSLLGQGDMWRFEPSLDFDVFKQPEPKSLRESEDVDTGGKNKGPQPTTWRRSRGPLKTGRERSRSPRQSTGEEDTSSCHNSDELALVGFHDDTELSQLFEPNGQVWVHHYCAMWSEGVHVTDAQLQDVDKAVYNALSHRCSYCRKFGASILCCVPDCGKRFHFPCASAGGCFQDAKTVSLLCPEHIDQAEDRAGEATTCIQCGDVGSIRDLLFCTSCGHHYHGSCFSPPVDMKPIVRAGWQCPNCKICQTCRTASDESKMLVCDKCDKGYHTFCLKPAMTTIPKNGWKCKNCRVCTDCESRTPGSGPSSRWHLNYSVCDSCYQQRNKGLCCPLCGKAYRHFHNKTMLPCMQCKKFVHIECDPTLNLESMSKLKDLPQDYICTVCRETDPDAQMSEPIPSTVSEESMESYTTDNEMVLNNDPMLTEAAIIGPSGATGGLTASSSQDSLFMYDDSSSSFDVETPSDKSIMSPLHRRESSKKNRQKNKHSSERHHHHHHQQQQQTPQPLFQSQSLSEKRRGPKIKVKIGGQVMGITTLEAPSSPISHHSLSQTFSLSSPAYSAQSMDGLIEEKEKDKDKEKDDDDDDGDDHPSTLILADASDLFIMDQDMCKACGSFGKDGESKMIVCTQCGQCYHPYCVSVTVTKVMLQKGWRCLDCTVCEGCGGPYDEGRLLLCDDCDISYHTYCLDPPLETVPKGNWKCKWCVQCVNCGSTSPGFACQWMNNYTQCGPCHSKMYCPVCFDSYLTDQLIIQCQQCDRWLHCECDGLHGEDEAELAADYGYNCTFCRPKTGKEGPLPPPPPPPSPPKAERAPTPPSAPIVQPVAEPPRQFFVDGVYLFASGLNQIKQRLQVTNPKKLKPTQQRRASQLEEPEDSILSGTMDQGQDEIGEDGVKKRKPRRVFGLGVGGFIVRQRSRQWLAKRQASYEEQEDPDKEPAGEKVEKPKRRRKVKKSKLEEAFPFYMQEAFFGKGILDQTQETTKGLLKNESDSEPDRSSPVKMLPVTDVCSVKLVNSDTESSTPAPTAAAGPVPRPHTSMSGSEQGEDIHSLDDLKEIMNEDLFSLIHDELKDEGLSLDGMDSVTTKDPVSSKTSEIPDNIAHMLSTVDKLDMAHIITEELANFDSKTVEDIFSGVLSESHPNSQTDANTPSDQFNMSIPSGIPGPGLTSTHRPSPHPGISSAPLGMRGPMGPQPGTSGLPPFGMPFTQNFQQPMNQRFSPGIGPAGPSMAPNSLPPWSMSDEDVGDSNKRTIMKWEQEEEMGDQATISCVLYVNMCHPDLKQKYPDWSERCKQIAKLWRKLTPEEKAPYLSKARKNRTSSRVQKAQKKKAALKSKNVSQELQRRHEIQKQQDSEAMPPPPAPPPLANAEHYMDGSSPVMSPHPGPSHYQRLSWQDESKAPGTSSTPDHPGIQSDQVFSPPSGSLMTDPYAFPAPTPSDPFSQGQVRPPLVRPHRLPSVHAFGASSPREDEGLFTAPGIGQRVRPGSDMFTQGSPTPGQEMFMGGPRRIQGPRLNMPVTVDASNPLGDSNQPRPPGDPYSFPPSTPQTPVQQDDPFMPSGPLTPDPFHPARQRGDMFPMGSPQMRPPLTPTSHMSEPGQPYPGSPIRMPDFRHPLARSNSLPDPYSMPLGTPRPQMDPSMSHSDMGQDSIPMYRGNRMPMQMPEHQRPLESALRRNKLLPRSPWAFPFMLNYPDGGENPGNIHHQQLRVILGQQTKQRMAKKQEEAERMMTGPPTGWPDGPEVLEGFPPRPPFRGPSPQGFMRGTHPSMAPQGPRPPFYPGFMQRPPMPETYGTPPQEGIMTDQRSHYLQMLQERISESGSVPSASHLPAQHVNVMPYSPAPQPAPSLPPAPEPHANIARHLPAPAQQPAAEEEIFTSTETSQASTSTKANVPDDGTTVETDTLLEGIAEKTAKPSLSSEEDKNEDDDLLSADGTFDILKYADPDLDLDLDDKMFEHLDFIDESHTGDAKKSEDELKEETKDGKDLDGIKARNAAASDFQAQFLEFNQRHKTETKSEQDAAAEEKEKETEVGQIAAMLQGTESLTASSSVQDMKPSGLDSSISLNRPAAFLQNLASPHMQMSPNQGPAQTGSSGLPSPKIIHSPRSGQPSPRTPGIQSPFNTLLSGRHSASPHSQPMTPAGPQLSPFSAGSVQIPFSPPSSASQQAYGQGPGSAPHSPYPTTGQPPFGNMSSPGPPHMMSPGYPPSGMGPRPGGYNQMGHPAAPRMPPMYGQPPHGMRGHDGQPGRFPRPLDQGMEGIEGLGPRMPQPMSMQDGRPHPMYQNMQPRSMRGPPPPSSNHPGMSQMGIPHQRHQFPGQPPRLSHSPQVRGMSARQPGPPFPGGPPGAPQNTLLDELLEQEKEEQKRQAEQQALMHRRDGEQGMPSMSPGISAGVPPVSGLGPTVHNIGGMQMRMDHPGLRMPGPGDGSGVWNAPPEGSPFQQGFSPRLMHPGMAQRSPVPFPGPADIRAPGPSSSGLPPGQQMPIGPPTPVSPPTGDMGPDYERQAAQYEEFLHKQNMYLESQVKTFEGQVNKLKRSKKTIQARQRLAKKNNQELNPMDTSELERISTEQSGLQKQLEAQRKLLRQHQHLTQDYKTKQQEQFGRMWTGGMAETTLSGSALPISHPRTPGGHNSVRLSPTARQEYEAYMQNRIRMANQQQQQQNRMRPPTTIIGDNNPFSEAFQQREQIKRTPMTPGPPTPVSAAPTAMPPPPGANSQPLRPPFNLSGANDSVASPSANGVTGNLTPTTPGPIVPVSSAPPAVSTTPGAPHTPTGLPPSPMSQPQATGPSSTSHGPQGQPIPTPSPGPGTPGPRGPVEVIGALQFFRERNVPFEGSGGPRFPRPPGPAVVTGFSEGATTGPRLPPYPGNASIYPQGPSMESNRMPFQQGMPFQQAGPVPPNSPIQIADLNAATQTVQKKKRKRKESGRNRGDTVPTFASIFTKSGYDRSDKWSSNEPFIYAYTSTTQAC
uniref:Uncharacterized protein n=1 Tax=Biomphalaria glabrata TaxID=6526 RepID=A0A2C9KCS1_BIOGL